MNDLTERSGIEYDADMPNRKGRKNPHAVALGRLGGKKGGKARAHKLSAKQLSEIGRKGARARWKGHRR